MPFLEGDFVIAIGSWSFCSSVYCSVAQMLKFLPYLLILSTGISVTLSTPSTRTILEDYIPTPSENSNPSPTDPTSSKSIDEGSFFLSVFSSLTLFKEKVIFKENTYSSRESTYSIVSMATR